MTNPVAVLAPKLESKVAAFVKEKRLPGAACGVVHGDELAWSFGHGFADVEAGRTPDARTLYRVASITKTFTGTAIMQLRDAGALHLDDPVIAHIPELEKATNPFGSIEHVTLRRLLSHESGLMEGPPGADWSVPEYEGQAERTLATAEEISVRIPANAHTKYSNLAYQLLGEVVARRSETPYVQYVRTNILEPLGMSSSVYEPLDDAMRERLAVGYAARTFSDVLPHAKENPLVWAEGGLVSCVEDLARWLSFQFREDGGDRSGTQVLSGSSLKEMHRPRYLSDEAWKEAFCISWYAARRNEQVWVQHSGGLHGFVTNVCFDPKEKVGAIVLLNGVGEASELSMDLAELALGAVKEAVRPAERPAAVPDAYASLLGLYVDPDQDMLVRLEWRDGKLAMIAPSEPEWRPTLTSTGEPYRFTVEPGWRESGEPVEFERLADGRIWSIKMSDYRFLRLDRVGD